MTSASTTERKHRNMYHEFITAAHTQRSAMKEIKGHNIKDTIKPVLVLKILNEPGDVIC